MHIEHQMKYALNKYNRLNPENPLPKIPHVFRHTFCTNMTNAGMEHKSLEYVMGHGDISTAMNVYTHARYDCAEASMGRILKFTTPFA